MLAEAFVVDVGKVIRLARELDATSVALPCALVVSATVVFDSSSGIAVAVMWDGSNRIGARRKTSKDVGLMPPLLFWRKRRVDLVLKAVQSQRKGGSRPIDSA